MKKKDRICSTLIPISPKNIPFSRTNPDADALPPES